MAEAAGAPTDPQWLEITKMLVPPPTAVNHTTGQTVFVLADAFTANVSEGVAEGNAEGGWCDQEHGLSCGTMTCPPCQPLQAGSQNIPTWLIWPAEAISLASDEATRRIAIDTLASEASWEQGNSFCSVFSQAARVGMPLDMWLPQLRATLTKNQMPNLVYAKNAMYGVEAIGATQAVADLMLQSVTLPDGSGISFALLFPITQKLTSCSFHRLRAKGGFVVSAGWDAGAQSLAGNRLSVVSEVGETFHLWLTWRHLNSSSLRITATASGNVVPAEFDDQGRAVFKTAPGLSYDLHLI
jgi:hypothetical protein